MTGVVSMAGRAGRRRELIAASARDGRAPDSSTSHESCIFERIADIYCDRLSTILA
jgi:hypothetical protein